MFILDTPLENLLHTSNAFVHRTPDNSFGDHPFENLFQLERSKFGSNESSIQLRERAQGVAKILRFTGGGAIRFSIIAFCMFNEGQSQLRDRERVFAGDVPVSPPLQNHVIVGIFAGR